MAKRTLQDSASDKLAKMAAKTKDEKPKVKAEDLEHLNTRIPKSVLKEVRVYCAVNEMNIQDFVAEALKMRLDK